VAHHPVNDGGGGRGVLEDLGPTHEGEIGSHYDGATFVDPADDAREKVGTPLLERDDRALLSKPQRGVRLAISISLLRRDPYGDRSLDPLRQ
jgi:hypothetical protein